MARRLTRIALLLTLAAGGPLLAADAAAPALKEGVKTVVAVTAMDLDVTATKGGKPVDDLTKDELRVRVDGKEFPLDYFARVEAGTLHGPDLATASPDLVLETLAGDAGNRFLPRQFLVFFDDEHLLPFERSRVIESLRDFLTRLSPSDRVSIVAYGGSTRVVVPYTSSKEDLLDGLARLEKIPPTGLRWETQFKSEVLEMRRTNRRASRDAIAHQWSEQIRGREKSMLADLRRATAALAARAGKRILIYVSDGFEVHPGQSLQQALGSVLNQWDVSVADSYRAVVADANRSGITIHALDAKGLTTDVDASESSPSPFSYFQVNEILREGLDGLARETGGLLVSNRNGFNAAMDQIYRESTSYYSIGITLTNVDPRKKDHAVEVLSTRPGVVIRSRRSYGAKTSDEASRDRMEMALLTPAAGGDFPVSLTIGAPKKGGGLGHRLAPFTLSIPLSSLTFLDDNGRKKSVIEVSIAAVEDNGARSGITADRKTIVVEPGKWETARSESYVYEGELKSGKGNLRFVASVRDVATDRIALTSAPVRID